MSVEKLILIVGHFVPRYYNYSSQYKCHFPTITCRHCPQKHVVVHSNLITSVYSGVLIIMSNSLSLIAAIYDASDEENDDIPTINDQLSSIITSHTIDNPKISANEQANITIVPNHTTVLIANSVTNNIDDDKNRPISTTTMAIDGEITENNSQMTNGAVENTSMLVKHLEVIVEAAEDPHQKTIVAPSKEQMEVDNESTENKDSTIHNGTVIKKQLEILPETPENTIDVQNEIITNPANDSIKLFNINPENNDNCTDKDIAIVHDLIVADNGTTNVKMYRNKEAQDQTDSEDDSSDSCSSTSSSDSSAVSSSSDNESISEAGEQEITNKDSRAINKYVLLFLN